MNWKLAKAFIPGKTHREQHSQCQDVVSWLTPTDDLVCVTMADGAGSASHAVEGARLATATARDMLREAVPAIFERPADEVAQWLIDGIQYRLHQEAEAHGIALEDYACTLLFIVSDGQHLLCGNLGDGCVACHVPADADSPGAATLLLAPEHGQYKNESFFVTTPGIHTHLRVCQVPIQYGCVYALMTDGTCDCLISSRELTLAPAFTAFAEWMRKYTYDIVETALIRNMRNLFTRRTDDDCAIALVAAEG